MGEKLTDQTIKNMEPPSSGNAITYDSDVAGFGVRITATGSKSFILNYRTQSGRERRYTIGPAGDHGWKTHKARDKAKNLKAANRSGHDPLAEIEAESSAPTVEKLAAQFLKDTRPRSGPRRGSSINIRSAATSCRPSSTGRWPNAITPMRTACTGG